MFLSVSRLGGSDWEKIYDEFFFLEGSCSKQKWKSTPLSCCFAIWQLRFSNSSLGLSSWFGSFNKKSYSVSGPEKKATSSMILPKSLLSKPPLVGGWTNRFPFENYSSKFVFIFRPNFWGVLFNGNISKNNHWVDFCRWVFFFLSWWKNVQPHYWGGTWSRKSQEVKNLGTVTG